MNPPLVGSEDYYRKRFEERIWNSRITDYLWKLEESEADAVVNELVEGLLVELGDL